MLYTQIGQETAEAQTDVESDYMSHLHILNKQKQITVAVCNNHRKLTTKMNQTKLRKQLPSFIHSTFQYFTLFLENFTDDTLLRHSSRDTLQQALVVPTGYIPEKSRKQWNCSVWI